MNEPRMYVYRGTLPLWLAVAVAAPLGALLLTSLALAGVIAAAGIGVAALVLPRLRGRSRPDSTEAIELDPSQYRHVERRDER